MSHDDWLLGLDRKRRRSQPEIASDEKSPLVEIPMRIRERSGSHQARSLPAPTTRG